MPAVSARALRSAVDRAGYYPDLVASAVDSVVAGEDIEAFVVHQETTFDAEEVRRHVTVLVLTPSRLVLGHADDHPVEAPAADGLVAPARAGGRASPSSHVILSTEAVPLHAVRSVVVTRTVTDPLAAGAAREVPAEATLSVGWGAVSRVDLEPASCADPDCDADHGYTGVLNTDDVAVRVSAAAEGTQAVSALLDFSTALSRATGR